MRLPPAFVWIGPVVILAQLAPLLSLACIPKSTTAPGTDQREIGIDVASPKPVVTTGAVQGPMSMETAAVIAKLNALLDMSTKTNNHVKGVKTVARNAATNAGSGNLKINDPWSMVALIGIVAAAVVAVRMAEAGVCGAHRSWKRKRRRSLFQNG